MGARADDMDRQGLVTNIETATPTETGVPFPSHTHGVIMKKHIALAAFTFTTLAALSAGAARADEADRPLTREEVVAQVMAARQSGELATLNAGGVWSGSQAESKLSRDEVAAQVLEARKTGELAALSAGGTWSAPSQTAQKPLTRDEVAAEVLHARQQQGDALSIEHSI